MPLSETEDEMKVWETFGNYLIHFLIFGFGIVSSEMQEFLLLYFPCTFLKVNYNSLDSNCIAILTKFLHTRVVISSPLFSLNTKEFFHRVWAKPLSSNKYAIILKWNVYWFNSRSYSHLYAMLANRQTFQI